MKLSAVLFYSMCKHCKKCKYSHIKVHQTTVEFIVKCWQLRETYCSSAPCCGRVKQWLWLMAISFGMGECPVSPYLSLSLSLTPFSPSPISAPPFSPHFSLLWISLFPLQIQTPHIIPPPTPSFSQWGCSSHCTLTALGYCVWKCSCWNHRPLQSTGQRLEHLCLRQGTFALHSHFRPVTMTVIPQPSATHPHHEGVWVILHWHLVNIIQSTYVNVIW